jgi:hypothetical protein
MAYWLWRTAIYLADTWRADLDDPTARLDYLPPIARPLAQGVWLERFVDCFDSVAERLAAGNLGADGLATCTGEEMALHIVIDLAEASLADDILSRTEGVAARLPDHGAADANFDRMRDVLFKDNDVLLLFDPSLDGIEDPDGESTSIRRPGSSLSPEPVGPGQGAGLTSGCSTVGSGWCSAAPLVLESAPAWAGLVPTCRRAA